MHLCYLVLSTWCSGYHFTAVLVADEKREEGQKFQEVCLLEIVIFSNSTFDFHCYCISITNIVASSSSIFRWFLYSHRQNVIVSVCFRFVRIQSCDLDEQFRSFFFAKSHAPFRISFYKQNIQSTD